MFHSKITVTALIVAASIFGSANTASAHDSQTDVNRTQVESPMVSGGFRPEVAKANGFEIVTKADGSQESVPVSAVAIAQRSKSDAEKTAFSSTNASSRGSADGNCGSSWINATKKNNDLVAFSTGYVVFGRVVDSQWKVVATGFVSGNSVTLSPGHNSGTWSAEGGISGVVGPGWAMPAPAASFAVLADGQVCYSQGPTASFG